MSITNKVVNKAIDYIIENLDMEIDVEDVATYCNFSKFYFNRVFRSETGESIYSFIKRIRLEKSAVRLGTDKNRSITDIGLDYGYSSSNYSSAFKKHHNISPIEFRKLKSENKMDQQHPFYDVEVKYENFDYYNSRIVVKAFSDFNVFFKRYIGNYKNMKDHWNDFLESYGHLADNTTKFLEVSYDDPIITDTDRCIYDICMTVESSSDLENTKLLKGGRFAVYSFEGSSMEIFQAFKGIFNIWLPESKYELDNRVGFDIYRKADSEKNYFEMDICIPVK